MKSTKATVRQRVEEVLAIRLQGAELYDIRRYASEQDPPWDVSDRQLQRHVERADDLLARTLERDREKLLNRHHAQRRALLARALEQGDVRTALAVVRDEAELLGLYPGRSGATPAAAETVPPPVEGGPPPFPEWEREFLAHHFTAPDSHFHAELDELLAGLHGRRGRRVSVIAPRGAAKSTRVSLAYPLYCAMHGLEPYVLVISDTDAQARQHLGNIKAELEGNDRLRERYPSLTGRGAVWRAGSVRLANGAQIDALGTGGKIRGRRVGPHRPSLIVVDDPQSIDHVISPVLRERSLRWLTADVCNAGSPETNILVLGTALHRQCIVCALQTTAGWQSRLYRALETFPDRMDLWSEWEHLFTDWGREDREAAALEFYREHREAMDAGPGRCGRSGSRCTTSWSSGPPTARPPSTPNSRARPWTPRPANGRRSGSTAPGW